MLFHCSHQNPARTNLSPAVTFFCSQETLTSSSYRSGDSITVRRTAPASRATLPRISNLQAETSHKRGVTAVPSWSFGHEPHLHLLYLVDIIKIGWCAASAPGAILAGSRNPLHYHSYCHDLMHPFRPITALAPPLSRSCLYLRPALSHYS